MSHHESRFPATGRTLQAAEKREIKKRGVLLSALGFVLLLVALVVYRSTGVTDAPWRMPCSGPPGSRTPPRPLTAS